MTLEEIKMFIKVDGDLEDGFIQILQLGAEEYLEEAGIPEDYTKHRYGLVICMLVKNWYDNREITSKEVKEQPYGIRTLIQQLQMELVL